MLILGKQKTLYYIELYSEDKEKIENVFHEYIEPGDNWVHADIYDHCEGCNNARILIQYDSKQTLLTAYQNLKAEPIPKDIDVRYKVDRKTLREHYKNLNHHKHQRN